MTHRRLINLCKMIIKAKKNAVPNPVPKILSKHEFSSIGDSCFVRVVVVVVVVVVITGLAVVLDGLGELLGWDGVEFWGGSVCTGKERDRETERV